MGAPVDSVRAIRQTTEWLRVAHARKQASLGNPGIVGYCAANGAGTVRRVPFETVSEALRVWMAVVARHNDGMFSRVQGKCGGNPRARCPWRSCRENVLQQSEGARLFCC